MPPLKNLKHEQFVQAYPKTPTAYQAYQSAYHVEAPSARVGSSKLMDRPEIKNRLLEVFQDQGLDDEYISTKLMSLTNANKENVQLGAIRTVLEVRKDIDSAAKIGIQVNVESEKQDQALERLNRYSAIIDRRKA